jgi:putative membrane protein
MTVVLIAAALAALLHVYIFVMESVLWTTPRVRATFGISSDAQAEHTAPLAFNQGFYNLFLAIVTAVGAVLVATHAGADATGAGDATGASPAGVALLVAGTGSMLAAALVLVLSDRSKATAATLQGVFPLVALVALLVVTVA